MPHFLQPDEVHGGRHLAVGREAEDGSRQRAHALLGVDVEDHGAQVVRRGAVGALAVVVDHQAVGAPHPLQVGACARIWVMRRFELMVAHIWNYQV